MCIENSQSQSTALGSAPSSESSSSAEREGFSSYFIFFNDKFSRREIGEIGGLIRSALRAASKLSPKSYNDEGFDAADRRWEISVRSELGNNLLESFLRKLVEIRLGSLEYKIVPRDDEFYAYPQATPIVYDAERDVDVRRTGKPDFIIRPSEKGRLLPGFQAKAENTIIV